jgi:hypothetical protein
MCSGMSDMGLPLLAAVPGLVLPSSQHQQATLSVCQKFWLSCLGLCQSCSGKALSWQLLLCWLLSHRAAETHSTQPQMQRTQQGWHLAGCSSA